MYVFFSNPAVSCSSAAFDYIAVSSLRRLWISVVLVHRLLLVLHATRKQENWRVAGTAFLEASATSYVCEREGWWRRTFGVLCGSGRSERAYVFIVRHKLTPAGADGGCPDTATICNLFCGMAQVLRVLHNDVHRFNAMKRLADGVLEAVDFERASQLARPCSNEEGTRGIATWFYYFATPSVEPPLKLELAIATTA